MLLSPCWKQVYIIVTICAIGFYSGPKIWIVIAAVHTLSILRAEWKINISGKPIVISGCDTGFGNMATNYFAQRNCTVFAGCLTTEGVKSFEGQKNVVPFLLDVSQDESVAQAASFVANRCPNGIWALINNAGIANNVSWFDFTKLDSIKRMFEVNYFGTLRCTKAFGPLVKRARGRILNMSSVAGRLAFQGGLAYGSSKAAIEASTDALRQEYRWFGIPVISIEPGVMKTAIFNGAEESAERMWKEAPQEIRDSYGKEFWTSMLDGFRKMQREQMGDPTQVVNALWHAATSRFPHRRYLVGTDANTMYFLFMLLPWSVVDWIVGVATKHYWEKSPTKS